MKYFVLFVIFVSLGDCADVLPGSRNDYVSGSRNEYASASDIGYGNVGQLKNYGGIFSPRYDYDQRDYQSYGPRYQDGQYDNGQIWQYNRQGNQIYGPAGAFFGNTGIAGNAGFAGNAGLAAGLGLSAALGLSAGLGAGIAGNIRNAIGVGINANLQLNLDANIALSNREDLVRPCSLDDWQCIRKFFSANSQCSPAYGPVPDPLYFGQSTLYIPFINLNLLRTNVRITGLGSAKVRDFYVNRITGNLVFTIDIDNLNETSPRTYMKYNRRGREPLLLADITAFAFSRVSLTIVIPRLPNLRLDLAEVHADYDDDNPTYDFGPGIRNSSASLVVSANAQLSANLQAAIRESFLFQAQLLAAIYIQQNICDFGLKLSST